ncbi:MAG TPA: cupin domain-containing protein [Vicinamibacterales bacterium]|nr:cupin domain-containing protein [Vicinamibacterales bacterium]
MTGPLYTLLLLLVVASLLSGCAVLSPGKRSMMALKNRTAVPVAADVDARVTLDAFLQPGDDRRRWSEMRAAAVDGYVVAVSVARVELANGLLPNRRDVHIEMAMRADAPARERVIVEVTPPMREAARQRGVDWSSEALERDFAGKWCRIEGWLLFDSDHEDEAENTNPGGVNNWRATAWEIHPVTAIAVVTKEDSRGARVDTFDYSGVMSSPLPQLTAAAALAPGAPERFTGNVQVATVTEAPPGPALSVYEVFFAPGARTVWHEHQGEQILVGLTGTCLVQLQGEAARRLKPGQAVRIAAGIRHWHGAAAGEPASHLGLNESLPTAWLDAVADADYAHALQHAVDPS